MWREERSGRGLNSRYWDNFFIQVGIRVKETFFLGDFTDQEIKQQSSEDSHSCWLFFIPPHVFLLVSLPWVQAHFVIGFMFIGELGCQYCCRGSLLRTLWKAWIKPGFSVPPSLCQREGRHPGTLSAHFFSCTPTWYWGWNLKRIYRYRNDLVMSFCPLSDLPLNWHIV